MLHIGSRRNSVLPLRRAKTGESSVPSQGEEAKQIERHTVRGKDVMTEPLRLRTRKRLELELRCPLPETGTGSPTQKNVLCD